MEAVPRLHMLWFALKSSPEGTSFGNLKKYIAEVYQEDAEGYAKEVLALETLRNQAMHPTKDGSSIMKRYYCQLHSLQTRFPKLSERSLVTFYWKDLYANQVHEVHDLRYEMAAVLFNVAASHTQVGASVTRGDADGMKLACTHFQCAAWTFGELRERYASINGGSDFMTSELLTFMQQVAFAQAQECILEKSLIDNRKPNIVAKVTAQIVNYYGAALAALLTGGDDGPVAQVIDSAVYKLWKKYVRFKIAYLTCILYLYQGQHVEEQQKMGERVTLYQAAWEKLEEARKESRGLPDQKEINESLIFTADVVEAKRKNAKNENEFIYHEAVPDLCDIAAVQGANLVNGISFSITDPDVAGEDIFARLVPMKAHVASSIYSEKKAQLLRKYGQLIEERDNELQVYMNSLTLEPLNVNEEKVNKIPQGIVDRCAALNANKTAISELINAMSQLAEITADVQLNLKEIGAILEAEQRQEHEFQEITGVQRTPNAHIIELTREYQKYMEAHSRAGESNDTLRKAMELHVNNLKILAHPLSDIQKSVPKLSTELNNTDVFKDVKLLVNKVNEMKAQRQQFHAELRIGITEDDITSKVIAQGIEPSDEHALAELFNREFAKHERVTQLIDQNLLAQKNILSALTDSYAQAAPLIKSVADVKQKRETFFGSLAASYDVYEDLLAKSAKGLEFYKKLSGNVQKLLTRLKSARDVQSEERQQRLKSVVPSRNKVNKELSAYSHMPQIAPTMTNNGSSSITPKLRDYLKNNTAAGVAAAAAGAVKSSIANITDNTAKNTTTTNYIPTIRPNPLGSEAPAQQTFCQASTYYAGGVAQNNVSAAPNEPPPPYSLMPQATFYDATMMMNVALQQQQLQQQVQQLPQQKQHVAPPAYKAQASPNSQFTAKSANMAALTLQHQQQQQNIINYNYAMQNLAASTTMSSNTTTSTNAATMPINYMAFQQPLPPQQQLMANYGGNVFIPTTSLQKQEQQQLTKLDNIPITTPSSSSSMQPLYVATTLSETTTKPAETITNNSYFQQSQQLQQQPKLQQRQKNQLQQHQKNQLQPSSMMNTAESQQQPYYPSLQQPHESPLKQQPQQIMTTIPSKLHSSNNITSTSFTSLTNHPGYTFNPQTGIYEYSSGYHSSTNFNKFFGKYTSASAAPSTPINTTDSESAKKINVATGFDSAVISHTNSSSGMELKQNTTINGGNNESMQHNYYAAPCGYQYVDASNNNLLLTSTQSLSPAAGVYDMTRIQQQQPPPIQQQQQPTYGILQNTATYYPQQIQQQAQQIQQPSQQHSIYMQSGRMSIAPTNTTKSAGEYTSSAEQQQKQNLSLPEATPVATAPKVEYKNVHNKNIDLLSDIDFSNVEVPQPILPTPMHKPTVITSNIATIETLETPTITTTATITILANIIETTTTTNVATTTSSTSSQQQNLTSLIDNFDNHSICSDLSSLETNFDWDALALPAPTKSVTTASNKNIPNSNHMTTTTTFIMRPYDSFSDQKILKYYHKDVERYEKIMESLNMKMLNGNTQLSAKWKELQDLLCNDNQNRTTIIAKLFPEKNRSLDCLPYDHARVKLERNTDDYINAAFIKNIGMGCPNIIIAQTPLSNTITDFWSMIWTPRVRTVLCLHTPNEMLDAYWPQELNGEANYDDFTIKCVKINTLTHTMEYQLKLSMHGADPIIDLSILQIKSWTKRSPSQILGIASNALQLHQQNCCNFQTPQSPIILACLNGAERSELLAIALCTILATQSKRPILINVVDVWFRICAARQNAARDQAILEQFMHIVLSHAHDVLNKRGIMTSYQMKIAPQVASNEKEKIKDPLNELDPLWKLKQK